MKTTVGQQMRLIVASLFVLAAIITVSILQFIDKNNTRIIEQNQQYLSDAALQSVKNINELFRNSADDIAMLSYLYERQLTEPVLDIGEFEEMADRTSFDYLQFVDADGISYTYNGYSADCSDREYYTEGMKGKSGIVFIRDSRVTDESALIFYTPLYYKGKVIGVINGLLSEKSMNSQMESNYFGVPADEYLCLRDGTVAMAYGENGYPDNVIQDLENDEIVSDEVLAGISDAFENGYEYNYKYSTDDGIGNAYISLLADDNFMLLQTFPAAATKKITQNANNDAFELEMKLIIAFVIYIVLVILYYIRKNRILLYKNRDIGQIIDSLKRLYSRFVVFDLQNDTYEYLEEGEISAMDIPDKGKYSEWLDAFKIIYADDETSRKMSENMSPENLQSSLNMKNGFIQYEYRVAVPGGTEDGDKGRWEKVSLIKLNMDEDSTKRVLAAVEDVTRLKEEEVARRHALEEAFRTAEAANNAKSDFLSRMSHDIRTPMNAIIGLTAIMGMHLDDRERIVDSLAKITSSSKYLLSLINEVLDMSKIESGKFSLSETECNLSEMIDETLGLVNSSIKAKHLNLSVNIRDVVHEDVIADDMHIQQVFVNVLTNAVKYTPEGGDINVTIAEKASSNPRIGRYEFVCEDTGIGIGKEFLERIFSPFERAEDVRVSHIQGTGLGLPIAKNIVAMMDGDITVESELGKGSKFTVSLSLKLRKTDTEIEKRFIGLPVLVADDDQLACESTCAILEELGINGVWVLTGQEAVAEAVRAHNDGNDFFAVILDWKMPGMDGVETARAIRREVGQDVPIIILSAYDWSDIESEAQAAGVDAFISKPLFKSRLKSVFMDLVSEPERTDENAVLRDLNEQDFSGKRVLLVEDNELNQEIAREILEMTGLKVDTAENGKVCVEMFTSSGEGYYDAIFMDIQMPIMNGYEATCEIRSIDQSYAQNIPIIAMTANAFEEDIQAAKRAGMNEHLAKPLDFEKLTNVLGHWL